MDSPASVVFDQSENRLHAQKALLALLDGTMTAATTAAC
jgi:ornithine carbamoyltransferase